MKKRTGDDGEDGNLLLGGIGRVTSNNASSWATGGGATVFGRERRGVVFGPRAPVDTPWHGGGGGGGGKKPPTRPV